jgi:hypothetical protein
MSRYNKGLLEIAVAAIRNTKGRVWRSAFQKQSNHDGTFFDLMQSATARPNTGFETLETDL